MIPTTSTEPASIVIDQESSTKSLHTVTVDGPGSARGTQVTPHTNENGTTSAIMASGSTQDEGEDSLCQFGEGGVINKGHQRLIG